MIGRHGDIDSHNWQGYAILFLNFSYFGKEPVAEKDLETIIEAGRHAPLSFCVCLRADRGKEEG